MNLPSALADVRHYYGEVQQSSGELKTDADCPLAAMRESVRTLGGHFGLFDCDTAPAGASQVLGACC